MLQIPEFDGKVADEHTALAAVENRLDMRRGARRKRRQPVFQLAQQAGERRLDRIGHVSGGQQARAALLGAVACGQMDFALASIDPEHSHPAVFGAQLGRPVDLDHAELDARIVVLEPLLDLRKLLRIVQMDFGHCPLATVALTGKNAWRAEHRGQPARRCGSRAGQELASCRGHGDNISFSVPVCGSVV
jgi:hypothetical protein